MYIIWSEVSFLQQGEEVSLPAILAWAQCLTCSRPEAGQRRNGEDNFETSSGRNHGEFVNDFTTWKYTKRGKQRIAWLLVKTYN